MSRLSITVSYGASSNNISINNNEFMFSETLPDFKHVDVYIDNLSWNTSLDISDNIFNYFPYPNEYSEQIVQDSIASFIGVRLHQNNSEATVRNNKFITKDISFPGKNFWSANIHNFGIIIDGKVIKTVIEDNDFSEFDGVDFVNIARDTQGFDEYQDIFIHNNIGK